MCVWNYRAKNKSNLKVFEWLSYTSWMIFSFVNQWKYNDFIFKTLSTIQFRLCWCSNGKQTSLSVHVVMVKSVWESQPIERRKMDSHLCLKREVGHPSLLHISNSKNQVNSDGGRLSLCDLQPYAQSQAHAHRHTSTHIQKAHINTHKRKYSTVKKLKHNYQHIQSNFSFQSIHVSSVDIYLFTY